MARSRISAGAAAMVALAGISALSTAAAAPPPNFVVVLVDDWGWGDLGANGFGAETPNMDSYAARGVRFADMHSNSVCTPTRSALQTGRLNLRMGVDGNFGTAARGGLALEEITVAQLLQQGANYSTSATGKVSAAARHPCGDDDDARCDDALRHRGPGLWKASATAIHPPTARFPSALSPPSPPS